ncbi:putative membrane-associated kinase regulator 6 [Capsicum annuum]|uniref:probable membrane-associated kinase regulator 6 n=1 Tax=Capsicum annuum TaxID=4072 RepID=UPI0007BEC0CF|nr:probable membrane-associated kinase regulator 6 [Capsicum annuum]
METSSQSLSIESFSYSWLVDLGDSFRASMDASADDYETAFIEMDPTLPPSKRFFNVNPQDLNFDFPTSEPLTLVHADELISNGFLMPLFIKKPIKMELEFNNSDSIMDSPASSLVQNESRSSSCRRVNRCVSLRRCRSLSRRILVKYLDFLRPFCQKIRRCSRIGRCRTSSGKEVMKKWEYRSAATSPRTSVAYSVDNWRRSCDSESSIYEAVLHCKRTINGK